MKHKITNNKTIGLSFLIFNLTIHSILANTKTEIPPKTVKQMSNKQTTSFHIARGKNLMKLEDYDQAVKQFSAAVKLDAGNQAARKWLHKAMKEKQKI